MMSNIFTPYNLAAELDEHFQAQTKLAFTDEEFILLVEALQTAGPKAQRVAIDAFKNLSREVVLQRIHMIARLNEILNVISNSSATIAKR